MDGDARVARNALAPLVVLSLGLALAGCVGAPAPDAIAQCPMPPDANLTSALPALEGPGGSAGRGATLFERECVKCHSRQLAARGSRFFMAYPRLDCPDYLALASDSYLRLVIAEGGPAVGRDEAMQPFGQVLGAQGLADVLAYLRGLPTGAP
jgi:mono/diheme cytochrome c family protein